MFRLASSRLRSVLVRLALAALAVGTISTVPWTTPAGAGQRSPVGWVVECNFVRHLVADPIVYPGQPGAGHLHDFFGNTTTDAHSTYASLLAGDSSCGLANDTGAYWVPAASGAGGLLDPRDADFYYRVVTDPARLQPFPAGLRIIAGDGHATSGQSKKVVYWDCENGGDDTNRTAPVDCGRGIVSAHVRFPDCWNGVGLDSADHKSHMAYSVSGPGAYQICPSTHPVPVPRLIYKLEWPLHDGARLTLSSGSAFTLHGDFVNSWDQRELERLVRDCLRAGLNCGTFNT